MGVTLPVTFTVCSISARSGSKGVPGKNLRRIRGVTLIERAIATSLSCDEVDLVFFSTDSPEMAEIARHAGAAVPELRNPELADDHTSLHLVTKSNLEVIRKHYDNPDIVIQYAPTCPFVKAQTISEGVSQLRYNGFSSAVSLKKVQHSHPYRCREVLKDGSFVNFEKTIDVESPRFHSRQDLPELWCTTGGLYIRLAEVLDSFSGMDFGFGERPYALLVDEFEGINIDEPIDYEFASFVAERFSL